ncbi:MAG: hypothetical protein AMJ81_11815 [Phycisphaerae bacterium SM23_33]|nr:MAG: hypothetical protein AMJ81_11815 [Phycisphaerae bacterium SM23_33]
MKRTRVIGPGRQAALILVLLAVSAHPLLGQTWWQHDPAEPGDWFDPANWSAGLPSAANDGYIDNGGTAVIAADVADPFRCYVGDTGDGAVIHSSGTVSSGYFFLARSEGSAGTYELSGDATLNAGPSLTGLGVAEFVQAGGTTTTGGLTVGCHDIGQAHYLLQSGSLQVSQELTVCTNGLFEQTGGTSHAAYTSVGYGQSGGGTFRLTGGTHDVCGRVCVNSEPGMPNEPRFELGGTGRLETPQLWIGNYGRGRFVQTGGECLVQSDLEIGAGQYNSFYELHGGSLSAGIIYVGDDWYDQPMGTFVQSGGSLTAGKLMVNLASRFEFTGGQMAFNGGLLNEGTFDFVAVGGPLELAGGSMLDLSKGTIANPANGRINAAANTLVMFPAGFDPGAELASYTSAGVTHVAGTTMTVPADQHLVAFGAIDGHVRCEGSLRVADSLDRLDITDGLEVAAGASVDFGSGRLTVEDAVSGVSGGEMRGGYATVGQQGSGTFIQNGGSVWLEHEMILADQPGSDGSYLLSGGEASAFQGEIGKAGTGRVVHTSGRLTLRNSDSSGGEFGLMLGRGEYAKGIYELSGDAELETHSPVVVGGWWGGDGRFTQTGGTVLTTAWVTVGGYAGQGIYELHDGRFEGAGVVIGGLEQSCDGQFIQDGGDCVVSGWMAVRWGGRYVLSGTGMLQASFASIGQSGQGLFTQQGGACTLGTLEIAGHWVDDDGTYELAAGTLQAGEILLSDTYYDGRELGHALLRQTGGEARMGLLAIAPQGRYEYSGGTLEISEGIDLNGEFDLLDSDRLIKAADGAVVDMQRGSFLRAQNAGLVVGQKSLTLTSPGADPNTIFGSFSSAGIVHQAGSGDLILPADYDLKMWGDFGDHVLCEGSLSARQEGELNLIGGLEVRPGGTVDLKQGDLMVDNDRSGITEGQLTAFYEHIGYAGAGRFVQNGGSNTVQSDLLVGAELGSDGTYELHGPGQLNTYRLYIGTEGVGRVVQTDGSCSVGYCVCLGDESGRGTYELQGGQVSAERILVGGSGGGHWLQTGGTAESESLFVLGSGQSSSLELSGGSLTAKYIGITGEGTAAAFRHTGGTVITTDPDYGINLGDASGQYGAYELSQTGQILAQNIFVGHHGQGAFTQTGGSNIVNDKLVIGYWTHAQGTYELSGGNLQARTGYVGYRGQGRVIHTGGSLHVTDLHLGFSSGADGTYSISGGSLAAANLNVGGDGAGTFELADAAAEIRVSRGLHFGPRSSFSAVPGAVIRMVGAAFENESTDPAALVGLNNLHLIFEGGGYSRPLEVGGRDLGMTLEGLKGNFALSGLTVGGALPGRVMLVDQTDNQPGLEALYVTNLTVNAGSYLDLNGQKLYYRRGAIDPAATIIGGDPIALIRLFALRGYELPATFTPTGGNYGIGGLAMYGNMEVEADWETGPETYQGCWALLAASLCEDHSSAGLAWGVFQDGVFILQDAEGQALVSGNVRDLELREPIDGGGLLTGSGLLEVTEGSLRDWFPPLEGNVAEISFHLDPADIDGFSQAFSAISDIALKPIPEPAALVFFAAGGVLLLRRKSGRS